MMEIAAAQFISKLDDWVRYILITLASLGGVALSRLVIRLVSAEIFDTLGIYLPLMAVNSIVVLCAAERARRENLLHTAVYGLSTVVGFSLVACTVGALRELMLSGSIWGTPVATVSFPVAATVFFGFIMVAFFGAAVQAMRRVIVGINLRLDNPTAEDLLRQQEERMVD